MFVPSNKVTAFHLAIIIGTVVWTGLLLSLYWWAANEEREHTAESIELKAESIIQQTQVLRSWIGGHGGVYVEVQADIQPNPLLEHVPERDILTPCGRKLTLLNSPAILRHIYREFDSIAGDQIRLVANQPLNPANMPDDWEKPALAKLAAGEAHVRGIDASGGKHFYRLIYPMKQQPACLDCHHNQTANSNAVVGGLSVLIDKTPYDKSSQEVIRKIRIGYLGIWFMGVFALTLFDITGARMLREIDHTATHDGLTQLNNRREIERLLGLECERAQRYDSPLSVLLLDIDHFKQVNDTYGHQVGDQALRVVANTLLQTIRKTDFAGRYGGEELLVLATNTSRQGAARLAHRLNAAIKQAPIKLTSGDSISVKVSIGVACLAPESNTPDSLVKRADDALYQAKQTGRDRVCLADQK